MTAADRVRGAIAALRNTAGEVVPIDDSDPDRPTTFAAGGRLTVAPGQTIASAWGNATYDQTVMTFASAADRNTQWPSPKDGAVCYVLDQNWLNLRRAGQWVNLAALDVQYGSVTITTDANGGFLVTYPRAFSTIPQLQCTFSANVGQGVVITPGTPESTATAFSAWAYVGATKWANAAVRVNWLAVL